MYQLARSDPQTHVKTYRVPRYFDGGYMYFSVLTNYGFEVCCSTATSWFNYQAAQFLNIYPFVES